MINPNYSWQWASSVTAEEFSIHFKKKRDLLLEKLAAECGADKNRCLKRYVESVLTQVGNQSIDEGDNSKAINHFLKKVTLWEGDYHYHVNSLLKIYLKAIYKNENKLAKTAVEMLHSTLNQLASEKKIEDVYLQSSQEKLLMLTCQEERIEEVQKLIEDGTNVNTCDLLGFTPLHIACLNGNEKIVELLLNNGKIDIDKANLQGDTALLLAAFKGYERICSLLIQHNAFLEAVDRNANSAISCACAGGKISIVKMLIKNGASLHNAIKGFFFAAEKGHLEIVKFFLESGYSLETRSTNNRLTPLMRACIGNSLEVTGFLIECGASLDSVDNDEMTVLHYAVKNNNFQMVKLLLSYRECSKSINYQNFEGVTPVLYACHNKNENIIKLLIEHGASVDIDAKDGTSIFKIAMSEQEFSILKLLCDASEDSNIYHSYLFLSILLGNQEMISFFEERGGDIDIMSPMGSKLMIASKQGQTDVALKLLEYGASVNLKDERTGETALMLASKEGHLNSVKLLLKYNAKIDSTNNKGMTALSKACSHSSVAVAEHLIDCKANVNIIANNGFSALGFALEKKLPSLVKKLINRGANINTLFSTNGCTPFDLLYLQPTFDITNFLNIREIALFLISKLNREMLTRGNSENITPLHLIAYHGDIIVAKAMLDKGADVNACSIDGITPFMVSCSHKRTKMIELFLEYGPSASQYIDRPWLFSTPRALHEKIFSNFRKPFLELFPKELKEKLETFTLYAHIEQFMRHEVNPLVAIQFAHQFPNKDYLHCVKEKIDPAHYMEFILSEKLNDDLFCDVDLTHLERNIAEEVMSEKVVDWDLEKLLALFENINFKYPEKKGYLNPKKLNNQGEPTTIGDLKEGLEILLDRIKKKTPLTGTPPEETPELMKYYSNLEIVLKQIGYKIEQMDPDEQATALMDICTLGLHCGNTVIEAYRMKTLFYGQLPKSFEERFFKELQLKRESTLLNWSDNTHMFSQYMYLIGRELNLPNAYEEIFSRPDKVAKTSVSKEEAMEMFLSQYKPSDLVAFAQNFLWRYFLSDRDESIDFFKTHVPRSWKHDFYRDLAISVEGLDRKESEQICRKQEILLDPQISSIAEALELNRCSSYFAEKVLELSEEGIPTGIKRSAVRYILLALNVLKLS